MTLVNPVSSRQKCVEEAPRLELAKHTIIGYTHLPSKNALSIHPIFSCFSSTPVRKSLVPAS